MLVIGIDPGPKESAIVAYDGKDIHFKMQLENDQILSVLGHYREDPKVLPFLAIENMACFGKVAGESMFTTAIWIGRFIQFWGDAHVLLHRKTIVTHITGHGKNGDSEVQTALRTKFGDVLLPKRPTGKLKGFANHLWSALAVAVTAQETMFYVSKLKTPAKQVDKPLKNLNQPTKRRRKIHV